jgi:hypothetical protein
MKYVLALRSVSISDAGAVREPAKALQLALQDLDSFGD